MVLVVTLAIASIISHAHIRMRRQWTCKSCSQATRSKSDARQTGCEVCNTVAEGLEECKKDLASKTEIINIILDELTQAK